MLEQVQEKKLGEDVDRLTQEKQALLAEATGQITPAAPAPHPLTQRGRGQVMEVARGMELRSR